MKKSFFRFPSLVTLTVLAVTLLPASGCVGLLTTVAYLVRGTDIPAEFNQLKGKKVAVVCQPVVSLDVRHSTAGKQLARQVSSLLEQRVRKTTVIDHRKVDEWIDENTWDEYAEIGDALKADYVVGIDLEDFDIFKGPQLYQGRASATLKVIDCGQRGKIVFERHLDQILYPPSAGIPMSERLESQFRREFIGYLADHIARHFYAHDPYRDHAQDAAALR